MGVQQGLFGKHERQTTSILVYSRDRLNFGALHLGSVVDTRIRSAERSRTRTDLIRSSMTAEYAALTFFMEARRQHIDSLSADVPSYDAKQKKKFKKSGRRND